MLINKLEFQNTVSPMHQIARSVCKVNWKVQRIVILTNGEILTPKYCHIFKKEQTKAKQFWSVVDVLYCSYATLHLAF